MRNSGKAQKYYLEKNRANRVYQPTATTVVG